MQQSSLVTFLTSRLLRLQIELQRVFDHAWRQLTGAPTLKHSQISPQLYLGGQHTLRGLDRLRRRGITAVVNMRTRRLHDLSNIEWLQTLHLPTPDQHAPTLQQLLTGCAFISAQLAKGGAVYVHCLFGEGRGPTMAIAYLMSTGMLQEDATALVQRTRGFARPTPPQKAQLQELAKVLSEKER
jgi:hypothetical protein